MRSALTFNEKLGLGIFVLFVPAYFLAAAILNIVPQQRTTSGVVWLLAWGIITLIGVVVAVASVFFTPEPHPSELRRTLGRFAPLLALTIALSINFLLSDFAGNRDKIAFAAAHAADLRGPPPRAVIYSRGIPDGGNAIIRSPDANPERFPQGKMVDLTGERIRWCKKLNDELWSCNFD
jgi:hypothetical protein